MLSSRSLWPGQFTRSTLARSILGRHVQSDPSNVRTLAAQLPPRIVIPEDDIEESFLKGSGPGGQKIVRLNAS